MGARFFFPHLKLNFFLGDLCVLAVKFQFLQAFSKSKKLLTCRRSN
jgi:hypothetical protein